MADSSTKPQVIKSEYNLRSRKNKTNLENNAIFFLECLATCHTIENISGETIGNSIDKRIFDNIDWNLNKSGINNDLEVYKIFM